MDRKRARFVMIPSCTTSVSWIMSSKTWISCEEKMETNKRKAIRIEEKEERRKLELSGISCEFAERRTLEEQNQDDE